MRGSYVKKTLASVLAAVLLVTSVNGLPVTAKDMQGSPVMDVGAGASKVVKAAADTEGSKTAKAATVTGTYGENVTWSYADGVLTISGSGGIGNVLSSSDVSQDDVETVIIEDGITDLDWYAFFGYSSLTSITIPESVTWICGHAFGGCSSLTEITIPEGVTWIAEYAFEYCTSLKSVNIPKSVRDISYSAFCGCTSLSEIKIAADHPHYMVEDGCLIDKEDNTLLVALQGLKASSITVPDGVTSIDSGAFTGYTSVTSITLPESVTYLGWDAFSYCTNLKSINIPKGITYIGYSCFTGCWALTEMKVAEDHPNYAFADGCLLSNDKKTFLYAPPGMSKVTIPEGVETIQSYTLSRCSYITEIVVPASVKTIGIQGLCSDEVTSIFFKGDAVEDSGDMFYGTWNASLTGTEFNKTVYYLEGTKGWDELQVNYPLLKWVEVPKDAKRGWMNENGIWRYYDMSGSMAVGWKDIDKKWYFFDGEGVMQTGWQRLGGKWYYMDSKGVMTTGWQKISNKWYYMDANGVMQTGWVGIGSKWYYMDAKGVMTTGWQKISNKWYYMDANGVMQTGWLSLGGKWYYMDSNGAMVTGKKVIGGKTYSFGSNGVWIK